MGPFGRFLPLLLTAWLGVGAAVAQPSQDPGTLFLGATVFPGFDGRRAEPLDRRTATAVLVRDGRVLAVGDGAQLASTEAGGRARRVDLTGLFVYPGFQDAHGELERLGAYLEGVDLAGCGDAAAVAAALGERAAAVPAGRWLVGVGWDAAARGFAGPTGRRALHEALSSRLPEHPVLVEERSGDGVLLNRAGLESAGLDHGEGWFTGAAAARPRAALPDPSPSERRRRILRGQEVLLGRGFTCVHLHGVEAPELQALARLHASGGLAVRVVAYPRADGGAAPTEATGVAGRGDDRLSVAGFHLDLDGALATRGAALIEPYSDGVGGRGDLRVERGATAGLLVDRARAGLQPSLGAAGDRAVALALDLLERCRSDVPGFVGLRARLEGVDLSTGDALGRLGSLGVVPSVQPARLRAQSAWAAARLGGERLLALQPWSSLADAAAQPLALGSGLPAAAADPRVTFHAALTRRPSAEGPALVPALALTAHQTLGAMTSGAAYAAAQEDRRGLIARGYGGDLTVLDVDLTRLGPGDAASALGARVVMTVVDGEILFDAR